MPLFKKNTDLKFTDLAMLSYPITALTLDDKLELLAKKGFHKTDAGLKTDLVFEKKHDHPMYEKIINSGGYKNISIPSFIQNLTRIINDEASWYTSYETNSKEIFDAVKQNISADHLIYHCEANDKTVSYYRIPVWPLASDIVILEVIQEGNIDYLPDMGGIGRFYIKSFLSLNDSDKGVNYENETIDLPIF